MSIAGNYQSAWEAMSVAIAIGQTTSNDVKLNGFRLFGIVGPSDLANKTIDFQASFDGGQTWNQIEDAYGNKVVVTISGTAESYIPLDPTQFAAVSHIRLNSNVAVGAATNIKLITRPL